MNKKEYQTVLLGALLKDVAKLIYFSDGTINTNEREKDNTFKSWAQFLAPWADLTLLEYLVSENYESSAVPNNLCLQNHNTGIRELCLLLELANNYSDVEKHEKIAGDQQTITPLTSVFSHLRLRIDTNISHKYYQPGVFSVKNLFPTENPDSYQSARGKLLRDFAKAMRVTSEKKWSSFIALYTHLFTILEDFCWCLPAGNPKELTDVSLFDHIRSTAAISAAMYQYHDNVNDFSKGKVADDSVEKFLLLTGDLSGIQRYIFDIASVGVGGVAKRLRARSFYLSAFSAGLAQKIVFDIDLPSINIITISGGNFFILLPNTSYVRDYLKSLYKEINRDFLNSFAGELTLTLAEDSFAGQDFRRYNQIQQRVREKLALSKLNPFSDFLKNPDGGWLENSFILEKAKSTSQGYCKSCGKLPATKTLDNSSVCTLCHQDFRVGTQLPNSKMIIFYDKSPQDPNAIAFPGGLWAILADNVPTVTEDAIIAYHFAHEEIKDFNAIPVKKVFWGYFVPSKNGQSLDFDAIASCSLGKKMLGIIKADVDNLGALFSLGLSNRGTISRVAALSRMLEAFFTGEVNHILLEKYPNIYLVYSGGDDLLAVGPWNESLGFINQLHTDFERFTGYNQDITLSAGITIVKPSFPIAHGVAVAEENLEKAKNKAPKGFAEGKDQCDFLGETVKWKHVYKLLEEGRALAEWIENDHISTRFVHHLIFFAKMFDRYCIDHQVEGLKYIPMLHYDVCRNVKRNNNTMQIHKWTQDLADINGISIRYLAMIARYALLARRSRNER